MNNSEDGFTIRFEDRDGNLIVNRKSTPDWYFLPNGSVDREFTEYSLGRDAKEKGVKIVRYTANKTGIFALVDYL